MFFPEGKNHEDLDWSFNLAKYISSYGLYDSYFYNYRVKRKGAITEFVKIKNTEDLLDIIIHHLRDMDNIKESTLYKGLSKYIISQKSFIDDSYNLLIDEHKEKLLEKYIIFNNLIKKLIAKGNYLWKNKEIME